MKPIKIIFPLIIIFISVLAVAAIFFNMFYADKILPNITINGESYSDLSQEEAYAKISHVVNSIYGDGIVFEYKDKHGIKVYKAKTFELGVNINIDRTVFNAFNYGHKRKVVQSLKEQLDLVKGKKNFEVVFELDEKKLKKYIAENMSDLETAPKNFGYEYKKGKFISIPSEYGASINENKIKRDILTNLSNLRNDVIKVELVKKEPDLKEDVGGKAAFQAYNLMSKRIILRYNSYSWDIQKDELGSWIKFYLRDNINGKGLTIKANKGKIRDYLTLLAPQINQDPINAQLEFKEGRVNVFLLSRDGITLDVEKSADELEKNIFTKRNYEDSLKRDIENYLVIKKVRPEIATEDINNLGLVSLLSTGESNFYGSPKNRKHNIAVGANKFHGVLIRPEEEFSFNKILGGVGPKEGYLPELVIKKGQTIPEYGGGLCQVSTTMFRAAVNAGLEITERKNHAYPVKYYNPQGTDATIYPPHPDLRFKNNTPAHILIQTRIEKNKLYFDLYGTNDGRKVKLDGPYLYDKKADGSMKAKWTQKVYNRNNALKFSKTFYSVYKSPSLYPHKNPLE